MAKFKKLAIISSAVLMTTAFAFGVAACGEEVCAHTYEKKSDETHTWYACTQEGCDSVVGKEEIVTPHVHTFALQKNDSKHWYECSDETCTEKVGEADHVWDEGEETLAPQVGVAGEYTYTCRVCGQTDVEAVNALTPNPLIVAEGSAVGANYSDKVISVSLEAGDYIAITDNDSVTGGQFTVDEAGEVEVYFSVWDIFGDIGADVAFNYTIKKVPSISPTEMFGSVEVVTYAWVKVDVAIPAGYYKISSESAIFGVDTSGEGKSSYVFSSTGVTTPVTFYAKAKDDNNEKTTVDYTVDALEIAELDTTSVSKVYLWEDTLTKVVFTAPYEGCFNISTLDDSLAFFADKDYTPLEKLNGYYYVEATEYHEEIEIFISSWANDYACFMIDDFTDNERYTTDVAFTFEDGATTSTVTANIKAGESVNVTIGGMGYFNLAWDNNDIAFAFNGTTATTQSVVFAYNPRGYTTMTLTNNSQEDIELDFTLSILDGENNWIYANTEVYVDPYGGAMILPVILGYEASTYAMSINSSNATVLYGFVDNGDGTSSQTATLSTTAQDVATTGEIEYLYVAAASINAEWIIITFAEASSGGDEPAGNGTGTEIDPYIIAQNGGEYSNLAFQTNPMGMTMNICFSYTATENGVMAISGGINTIGYSYYLDNNTPIELQLIEDTMSFNVVAGIEYIICICPQDLANSPISPIFTFTANA